MPKIQSTPADGPQAIATLLGKAIYLTVALLLLLVALVLIGVSLWGAWQEIGTARAATFVLLDAVGMTVLGLAIVDVSKYLIEEEVFRERELRSPSEARGALTKFLTIITIVVSLEAVILIFEASKSDRESELVYPALLLGAVVAIVTCLGLYQFLSARAQAIMQPIATRRHGRPADDPADDA